MAEDLSDLFCLVTESAVAAYLLVEAPRSRGVVTTEAVERQQKVSGFNSEPVAVLFFVVF